jgi:hypothetical protein
MGADIPGFFTAYRVAILGLGLMGGSLAMALHDKCAGFFGWLGITWHFSIFSTRAARQLGWVNVPLMCMQEIPVPGGLPRCIRVLLHWNTDLPQPVIHHIYLEEAVRLRPDLTNKSQEVPL